jgi:hypothetical protein
VFGNANVNEQLEKTGHISTKWGETFYWTSELSQLLALNGEQFPTTWTFTPEMLPTQYGFCWFATPLPLPQLLDLNGEPIDDVMVAFSWAPVTQHEEGTFVIAPINGVPPWADNDVLGLVWWGLRAGHLVPWGLWSWAPGQTLEEAVHRATISEDPVLAERRRLRLRYFAAALTFMAQRLTVTSRERPTRATLRRCPPRPAHAEPVVRVVQLRQRVTVRGEDHASASVDWSCRWLVRGHWRQQYYARGQTHRTRWIHPYVKGPDDKALKPSRGRLFAVVR